jgi:hypothetical protein
LLSCSLDTADPIADIAYDVGFDNPPAFHRAFRHWTGSMPNTHRRIILFDRDLRLSVKPAGFFYAAGWFGSVDFHTDTRSSEMYLLVIVAGFVSKWADFGNYLCSIRPYDSLINGATQGQCANASHPWLQR